MRVLHVLRSPVGGAFRHVADLARGQAAAGHEVGILCDSLTGGPSSEAALQRLAACCSLGIKRIPIPVLPGLGDLAGRRHVIEFARTHKAQVIHGHGSKGGVYARLCGKALGLPSFYAPHGGSLHYDWQSPTGFAFLSAEKAMRLRGSHLLFVCEFEKALFERKVGFGPCPARVVYNGLWPEEFVSRELASDVSDLLFVGEMRRLKGVDVLLDAIASLPLASRPTATLVGDGPDLKSFQAQAEKLRLQTHVKFAGRLNMVDARCMGRIMVMPSRHESFPYVALEAMAAEIPLIASNVGGIPELLPPALLVEPGDVQQLAGKIAKGLIEFDKMADDAKQLALASRSRFSVPTMVSQIVSFYETAL